MKSSATDTTDSVQVVLDPATRPGLLACGRYRPGVIYTVPRDEAERLVSAKGFRLAAPADPEPASPAPSKSRKST